MRGGQCEPVSLALSVVVVFAALTSALESSALARVVINAAGDAVLESGRASYRLKLENANDALYTGTLEIGGQRVVGVFDTGSFDLVVMSNKCRRCRPSSGTAAQLFDASRSRTHINGHYNRDFRYMSGTFNTRKGYEMVKVGPLRLEDQCIWEVLDADMPILQHESFDAIFGMAGMSDQRQEKSLLQSLDVHHFSICFGKPSQSPGYLVWNDRDPRKLPHVFAPVPIFSDRHWATQLFHVKIGHEAACKESCAVLLDSGSTAIGAPPAFIERVAALIRSVDDACSNLEKLPPLTFKLGDAHYWLPPSAYVSRAEDNLVDDLPSMEGYSCTPLMMPLHDVTDVGPLWILGMQFFRQYYTTFQVGSEMGPDRAIYTAHASEDCEASAEKGAALFEAKQVALTVDMSKARLPLWLPNNGSKLVL